MIKKGILLIFFSVCALQITNAQTVIGYTNPQKILESLPQAANIQQEIVSYYQEIEGNLAPKADSLQAMIDEYEKVQANLSPTARQEREDIIVAKNQEFEAAREQGMAMVEQRQITLLTPIRALIAATIKSVAEDMNIDIVLNEATSQGSSIIYYAADQKLNITDKVIEILNK